MSSEAGSEYPSYTVDPNSDPIHRVLLGTVRLVTESVGPVVDFIAREPTEAIEPQPGDGNRPPSPGESLVYGGAATLALYGIVQYGLSKARQTRR